MAKIKYDVEKLLSDFEENMKVNLDYQIELINTEKGDETILDKVSDDAWFFETLDDSNHNYPIFMFYQIDSMRLNVAGPSVAREVTIELLMFMFSANELDVTKKVLRYWRAIQDAMIMTWDKLGLGYDRPTMDPLFPIDIKLSNSSHYHKVFGASINFTLP